MVNSAINYIQQAVPTIVSGENALELLSGELSKYLENGRILVVTSEGHKVRGTLDKVKNALSRFDIVDMTEVRTNPDIVAVDLMVQQARKLKPDVIIGLGGGSAIDCAKAIACVISGSLSEPFEARFRQAKNETISRQCILVAIPTTSGTGAEVTPFATLWDNEKKLKYSLSDPYVAPDIAVLEPGLIVSLPYYETLCTGLDTLSHSLESLWNKNANKVTDAYAFQALDLTVEWLPVVLAEPANEMARAMMQQASLLAGLAISHTRTAIAHSISYPLTSYYDVPHGLACSFSLPAIIRILVEQPEAHFLSNYHLDKFKSCLGIFEFFPKDIALKSCLEGEVKEDWVEKMVSKGRSDNFILPVDNTLIYKVLEYSELFYRNREGSSLR